VCDNISNKSNANFNQNETYTKNLLVSPPGFENKNYNKQTDNQYTANIIKTDIDKNEKSDNMHVFFPDNTIDIEQHDEFYNKLFD